MTVITRPQLVHGSFRPRRQQTAHCGPDSPRVTTGRTFPQSRHFSGSLSLGAHVVQRFFSSSAIRVVRPHPEQVRHGFCL